jgi:hypothetical protein
MRALLRRAAFVMAIGGSAGTLMSSTPVDGTPAGSADVRPGADGFASVEDDPRVRAFVQAYAPLIDSVIHTVDDVVFAFGERRIRFEDGRMLDAARPGRDAECDPIFYRYPLQPLAEPPSEPPQMPTYCTDVLETLWGDTEEQVRAHGRSVEFLDHRMFVNDLLVEPLAAVESNVRRAAETDADVAGWIRGLDITYSFSSREIAGSGTRSQHSWGMAIDLVPASYEGRHAYWRWSRVFDRDGWYRIPVEQRWSPPQRVIEIFEAHGFVWGGKWPHFDQIHFEYRPEILFYNRMAEQ